MEDENNDTPNTTRLRESMMMILNDLGSPDTPELAYSTMDMSCYSVRKPSLANDENAAMNASACPSSCASTPASVARTPLQEARSNIATVPAAAAKSAAATMATTTTTTAASGVGNKSVRFESPAAPTATQPEAPASVSGSESSSFTAITPPGSPSQSWMSRAHEELTPARARVPSADEEKPVETATEQRTQTTQAQAQQPVVQRPPPMFPTTTNTTTSSMTTSGTPVAAGTAMSSNATAPKTALFKSTAAASSTARPSPLGKRENAVVIAPPPPPPPVAIKFASKSGMFAEASGSSKPAAAEAAAPSMSAAPSAPLNTTTTIGAAPAALNETWVTTDKARHVLQSAKVACTGQHSPRTMKQMQERKERKDVKPSSRRNEPEISFVEKVRKFQEKAEESMLNASRVAFGGMNNSRSGANTSRRAINTSAVANPRTTKPAIINKKPAKTRGNLLRLQLERSLNRSAKSEPEEEDWEDVIEEESSMEISQVSFEVSQIPDMGVAQARMASTNASVRHVSFSVPSELIIAEDADGAAATTPTQPTALGRGDQNMSFSPLDITQQDLEAEHLVRSSRAEAVLARLRGDTGATPIKLPKGCDANFLDRAIAELQELKKSNVVLSDAFKKLEAQNQDLRRQLRQSRNKADHLNRSQEQSMLAAEFELQQELQDMQFRESGWETERDNLRARVQVLERDVCVKREEIFALKAAAAMEQAAAASTGSATANASSNQDEVAKINATWQKTLSKLQCVTTELEVATERANSAEARIAALTESWDQYKDCEEARILNMAAQITQRDMTIVELKACMELLRTEKDKVVAELGQAKQATKSRDQFTSTLYGLKKEDLYDLLSDQDQQLQAAQTEVVRLRKRLKDISERTAKERATQQRATTDLTTKMHNLQCLLRDLEEKNPNMTRQMNESQFEQFPGDFPSSSVNVTQMRPDHSFSIYDNFKPGTSFMLESSMHSTSYMGPGDQRKLQITRAAGKRKAKKRNIFQRLRDRLKRNRREQGNITTLNGTAMHK